MPATAAAMVVAAVRGLKGAPAGTQGAAEVEARRTGRALLWSALLLFTLMAIPSPQ